MIFQKTETVTGTYIPELNDALCTGAHLIDAIPKDETLSLYFAGDKEGTADLLRISAVLDGGNKPSLSVEFVPGEWDEAKYSNEQLAACYDEHTGGYFIADTEKNTVVVPGPLTLDDVAEEWPGIPVMDGPNESAE